MRLSIILIIAVLLLPFSAIRAQKTDYFQGTFQSPLSEAFLQNETLNVNFGLQDKNSFEEIAFSLDYFIVSPSNDLLTNIYGYSGGAQFGSDDSCPGPGGLPIGGLKEEIPIGGGFGILLAIIAGYVLFILTGKKQKMKKLMILSKVRPMKKTIFSLLTAMLLLGTTNALAQNNVTNWTQLRTALTTNSVYIINLQNDLDKNTAGYSADWSPPTDVGTKMINGNNYAIRDLVIKNKSGNVGLIGSCVGSLDVSDLTLEIEFTGITGTTSNVGGLVGSETGAHIHIKNSYVKGSITGSAAARVGGFVGYSNGPCCFKATNCHSFVDINITGSAICGGFIGEYTLAYLGAADFFIDNSHSSGNIQTGGTAGGLAGLVAYTAATSSGSGDKAIKRSYSAGNIKGSGNVGGLVGSIPSRVNLVFDIENSYSTGNVTNTAASGANTGGLVGNLGGGVGATIKVTNCYTSGFVTSSGNVGALVGTRGSNGTTITNCYYDQTVTGLTQGVGSGTAAGTRRTTANMLKQTNFSGFGFTGGSSIWVIDADKTYPYLRWQLTSKNADGTTRSNLYTAAASYSTSSATGPWNSYTLSSTIANGTVWVKINNTAAAPIRVYNVYANDGEKYPLAASGEKIYSFTKTATNGSVGVSSESDIIAFSFSAAPPTPPEENDDFSSIGRDFWLSFGNNAHLHKNPDPVYQPSLQVRIVAVEATTGTLHFTRGNRTQNFSVPAGGSVTIDLDDDDVYAYSPDIYSQKNDLASVTRIYNDKAVNIRTNKPVAVYANNMLQYSSDATYLLPTNVLGTDYYLLSYSGRGIADEMTGAPFVDECMRDGFLIIATQAGTQVSVPNVMGSGNTTVNLNKGDVYVAYKHGDLTGSRITSNKPIALYAVNEGALIPTEIWFSFDHLYEAIAPISSWGNEFFVPASHRTRNTERERIRVLASESGTAVYLNGSTTAAATLAAGTFHEFTVTTTGAHIKTSKPAAVASYLVGKGELDGSVSDPAMAWVPSVHQSLTSIAVAPFSAGTSVIDDHRLIVVTKTAERNATTMKVGSGAPVTLNGTMPSTGTGYTGRTAWSDRNGYSYRIITVNASGSDLFLFENPAGVIVYAYGMGSTESYFYTAGAAVRTLDVAFNVNDKPYQDVRGNTFYNTFFAFDATTALEDFSDFTSFQWSIGSDIANPSNNTVDPSLNNLISWTRNLPARTEPYVITMTATDGNGKEYVRTTYFYVASAEVCDFFTDDLWFFGQNGGGVAFNDDGSGNIVPVNASGISKVNTNENSLVVSSPGCGSSLIFYAQHDKIYNAQHEIMPGGEILGNWSCADGLAAAYIGDNRYMVFSVTAAYHEFLGDSKPMSLVYYIVDMNLDGGNGAVVRALDGVVEPSGMSESIELIPVPGTSDQYWLIYNMLSTNEIKVRKITGGATPAVSPYVSSLPMTSHISPYDQSWSYELIANKDNTQLALSYAYIYYGTVARVSIIDFNQDTGALTHFRTLETAAYTYGVEFSSNGQYLFYSTIHEQHPHTSAIFQHNISANTTTPGIIVGGSSHGGGLKTGPDGKIYVLRASSNYLGVIENPNNPFNAGEYTGNGFNLGVNGGGLKFSTGLTPSAVCPAGLNNPPVAVNDAVSACLTGNTDVSPMTNDSDPDGDAIRIMNVYYKNPADASKITFTWTAGDAYIRFTPTALAQAGDEFTFVYTISDNGNPLHLCDDAEIKITVTDCSVCDFFTDDVWFLGQASQAGIAFNDDGSGNKVAVDASGFSLVNTAENSLVVSSPGCGSSLIFYAQHDKVFNKNHEIMKGGNIEGHYSCADGLAAAYIGANKYILFSSTSAQEELPGTPIALKYYIIDMNEEGGNGELITPAGNTIESTGMSETMELIPVPGTFDQYWLIYHMINDGVNGEMRVRKITGNNGTPTIGGITSSYAYNSIPQSSLSITYSYVMKANKDYTQLAIAFPHNHANYSLSTAGIVHIYNFNQATGALSFFRALNTNKQVYDVEFSPSGDYLYYSNYTADAYPDYCSLYQHNIAGNTTTAPFTIATAAGSVYPADPQSGFGGGLKTGSDGKLYISRSGYKHISIIANPDDAFVPANFVANGLELNVDAYVKGVKFSTGLTPPALCPEDLNSAPVAVNDAVSACITGNTDVSPMTNDSDPDGDAIRIMNVYYKNPADASKITFTWTAGDAFIRFTPTASAAIGDEFTFTYTIADDGNPLHLCAEAEIKITITDCSVCDFFTDDVWFFGQNGGGVAFNDDGSGNKKITNASGISNINTIENSLVVNSPGCGSSLIFYMDHNTMYNAQHSMMLGGEIEGHKSCADGLAAGYIGDNKYIVFSITSAYEDRATIASKLVYYIVDMNGDNGNGAVMTPAGNVLESTGMSETMELIPVPGTTDQYWLVYNVFSANEIRVCKVTGNNGVPTISTPIHTLSMAPYQSAGSPNRGWSYVMKANKDYTQLAITYPMSAPTTGNGVVSILDFNRTTGAISHFRSINTNKYAYDVEFSPNGNYLFFGTCYDDGTPYRISELFQHDIAGNTTTPAMRVYNVGAASAIGAGLKTGPDGKLYVLKMASQYLGVIEYPNMPFVPANYKDQGFNLGVNGGGFKFSTGLTPSAACPEDLNDAPLAMDDALNLTIGGGSVCIEPMDNDSDPDGDAIRIMNVYYLNPADASKVSFSWTSGSEEICFTPLAGASAGDVITLRYTISDNGNPLHLCDEALITITIIDEIAAVNDYVISDKHDPIVIDVLGNDDLSTHNPTDPGTIVTIPTSGNTGYPDHGIIVVNPSDNTITYTPTDPTWTGVDEFTYTVTTPGGATDQATVYVIVIDIPSYLECPDEFVTLAIDMDDPTGVDFKWYRTQSEVTPISGGARTVGITKNNIGTEIFWVEVSYGGKIFPRYEVKVEMVPQLMYWKKNAIDHNWNNPANWVTEDGNPLNQVPRECTDVHIPGNATFYPSLDATNTPRETYGEPVCRDITYHFGGEVAKPHQLTYRHAYVQYNFGKQRSPSEDNYDNEDPHSAYEMERGRWYALAAPLKKIATGDFSVGGFPNIYQQGFKTSRDRLGDLSGDWYVPENTMAMEIGARQNYAISVYAGEYCFDCLGYDDHTNLNGLNGILEMPYFEKADPSNYHRLHTYDATNKQSIFGYYWAERPGLPIADGVTDVFPRGKEAYRYIFEDGSNNPISNFEISVPVNIVGGTADYVMIANPFVSSLNFNAFYAANASRLADDSYHLFEGGSFEPYTKTDLIAPMQAFFVRPAGTHGTEVKLSFTEAFSVFRAPADLHQLRSSNIAEDFIRVEASSQDGKSWIFLSLAQESGNSSPRLFSKDKPKAPQIYSLDVNEQKNDIQYISTGASVIPLGIRTTSKGAFELKFNNIAENASIESLILKDKELRIEVDLLKNNAYSFENRLGNLENRFELSIFRSATAIDNQEATALRVYERDQTLYVESNKMISNISISNAQGIMLASNELINDYSYVKQLDVPSGVYLIKIVMINGETQTEKVIVK